MQRATQTAEERWLEKAVKEECTWENLPRRLHPVVCSKEEWHKRFNEIYVFTSTDIVYIIMINCLIL